LTCQIDPACQQLQEQGISAHNQLRHAEAVELYQKAFARVADPRLLVLMGRSKFKLGDAAEALSFYRKALPSITDPDERARLDRFISEAQMGLPLPASRPPGQAHQVGLLQPLTTSVGESKPLHRKWWLWTVVGVVAASTGVALGLGIVARGPDTTGVPQYRWFPQ
jgi:tetratricopeptide (TPR) repeat protein